VGSTYHHFANTGALFAALADRFAEELDDHLSQPYSGDEAIEWQSIVRTAVARASRLYNERADYRQLILGGAAPAEIKLSDRENDETIGQIIANAIGQHFEVPDFPRQNEIFFYAVEIADLLFMLSQMRHGKITPDMCREAQLAMVTYLRAYLPEQLPRKST
jgi:AcrR family transcriptional regulator